MAGEAKTPMNSGRPKWAVAALFQPLRSRFCSLLHTLILDTLILDTLILDTLILNPGQHPARLAYATLRPQTSRSRPHRLRPTFVPPSSERGAEMVEFALTMPIALTVLTGLLSFGVYMNKSLELTNATSLTGQYLALNRGTTAAADPCALVVNSYPSVAPYLQASSLSFSFVFNGVSYTNVTSCTAGAVGMYQGASATITVTYPCTLGIYGVELAPGCTLKSQVTEIIQ